MSGIRPNDECDSPVNHLEMLKIRHTRPQKPTIRMLQQSAWQLPAL